MGVGRKAVPVWSGAFVSNVMVKGTRASVYAFSHVLESTAKSLMAVTTKPQRTSISAAADQGCTSTTRGGP